MSGQHLTEVWPGCVVGSGLVPEPAALVRQFRLQHVVIASPSVLQGWPPVANLDGARLVSATFTDDHVTFTPTPAQLVHLIAKVATVPAYTRVAFLCYAGQNRSCFLAALWRWWHTRARAADIIQHLRAQHPRALTNPAFETVLRELDQVQV